jgi:carbon storage regulator CsrA
MLVLSRKQGEIVFATLPDGRIIEIRVVRLSGDSVKIGVECDRQIPIRRGELDLLPRESPDDCE